jgi:hypothetical protein
MDPVREEELRQGAARFAEWRRTRQRGTRIPVELWELAVELAQQHGVSRASQALPVAFYALQERVAACGRASDGPRIASSATSSPEKRPEFVELPATPFNSPVECSVEFEKPCGAKLRIQIRGSHLPDLAGLCRAFAESP